MTRSSPSTICCRRSSVFDGRAIRGSISRLVDQFISRRTGGVNSSWFLGLNGMTVVHQRTARGTVGRYFSNLRVLCRSGTSRGVALKEVTIAGHKLEHFHIAALFRSREEEYEVLHSYIKEGIDAGEKAVHICDPK